MSQSIHTIVHGARRLQLVASLSQSSFLSVDNWWGREFDVDATLCYFVTDCSECSKYVSWKCRKLNYAIRRMNEYSASARVDTDGVDSAIQSNFCIFGSIFSKNTITNDPTILARTHIHAPSVWSASIPLQLNCSSFAKFEIHIYIN